jgi:flagellar hook-associated protein 1
MSDSIFNTGISGLNAAQWGLNITGQNISNAATPGYSVEAPVYVESSGQYTGSGYIGGGVTTSTVTRSYSSYLNQTMNSATSTSNSQNTYFALMSQLNNLVGSPTAGISTGMSSYFSGMQSVSTSPSTTSTRQSALSSAQSLADQFNAAASTYDQLRESVNTSLSSSVAQINSFTTQIASLNQQISVASAQGQPPNQLLDARDLAVTNLNALVGVNVTTQNGNYNVTFGNGQPLVIGTSSYAVETTTSASDPSELSLAYAPPAGTTPTPANTQYISDSAVTGGSVGGMLQFRDQSLDPAQAQLGALATSFAGQVNAQNEAGVDLSGNAGTALFTTGSPTVYSNAQNTGTAVVSATITNPSQPPSSDYTLTYTAAGTYTVSDSASGATLGSYATMAAAGTSIGMTLTDTGTPAAGDSFTILPTRGALDSFALSSTSSAAGIAAETPVVTATAPTANTGNGTVTSSGVVAGFAVGATQTVTYAGGTPPMLTSPSAVTLANGTTVAANTPFAYTAGSTFTVGGVNMTISGTPSAGDTFTATAAASGPTDGSNALALSLVGQAKSMNNGTDTLTSAYANYVNDIGNTTDQLQTSSTSQTAVLNQVTAAQQSVSGVNLNEEAANLIQYQQLYQANSKVIQTASTLFQTLLGIFS